MPGGFTKFQQAGDSDAAAIRTAFPRRGADVTPDDNTSFANPSVVWCNVAGTAVVEPWLGGNTVSFVLAPGQVIPVMVKRVLATGTSGGIGLVRVYEDPGDEE